MYVCMHEVTETQTETETETEMLTMNDALLLKSTEEEAGVSMRARRPELSVARAR